LTAADPGPDPHEPPAAYGAALARYYRWVHEHAAEILTTPDLETLARYSQAALGEAATAVAQLRAQLDAYAGRTVYHTTAAALQRLLADPAALASCAPGDILRATDTGQEWVRTPGGWLPR
jgi:hypothetical protein